MAHRFPLRATRSRFVAQCAILISLSLLSATGVFAEKADSTKPVRVEADRMLADDTKKESVFEGHVVVTQGTRQMRGDRVIVRQDAEGFQYGIAYGKPASFREKREGFEEYVEGFAERVEYDGKKELLQMFNSARLKKGDDEAKGEYISYNAKTEFFQVQGSQYGATTNPGADGKRVITIIQPKSKDQPPPAANKSQGGTTLKPEADLATGSKRK